MFHCRPLLPRSLSDDAAASRLNWTSATCLIAAKTRTKRTHLTARNCLKMAALALCLLTLLIASSSSKNLAGYERLAPANSRVALDKEPLRPGAYLAINPWSFTEVLGSKVVTRRLELNWHGLESLDWPLEDVRVSLYDQEPGGLESAGPVLILDPAGHPDDYFITDIQLEHLPSKDLGYTSRCAFSYWVRVETSQGQGLLPHRCLQTQPTWQEDHKAEMKDLALGDMMLTASHDAAAYQDFKGVGQEWILPSSVYTQEEDLQQQLQWGVRFLDIRIGHYPALPEKFWLVHSVIRVHPLVEGLEAVKEFLKNTRDVIIWDNHSFRQDWDDTTHRQFKSLLMDTFETWWVKPQDGKSWKMTLQEIWSQPGLPENEGRIIFMYEDIHHDPEWFFPNIPERWGDKDEPEELKSYLDDVTETARQDPDNYSPWRPNCQMTETPSDVIFQKYSGLREMAHLVNRNATLWWRTDYSDLAGVYTLHDFVLGTDMVQVAIDRNLGLAGSTSGTSGFRWPGWLSGSVEWVRQKINWPGGEEQGSKVA